MGNKTYENGWKLSQSQTTRYSAEEKIDLGRYGSFGHLTGVLRLYLNSCERNGIKEFCHRLRPVPGLVVSKSFLNKIPYLNSFVKCFH